MQTYPRFKGAPFNPRTIRWHKTKRGWEWQAWNYHVNRFTKYTREKLDEGTAIQRMAAHVYGCDPEAITVER